MRLSVELSSAGISAQFASWNAVGDLTCHQVPVFQLLHGWYAEL